MIETSRRSLIIGLSTLIAAPAIVRASSLMKVKPLTDLAGELAKQEIMWLPHVKGFIPGDLIHLTPPPHWNSETGVWRVIKAFHVNPSDGTMLERVTKAAAPWERAICANLRLG